MIKQGKKFDDVVRNEKQQLLNLLKDYGNSKPKIKKKTQEINVDIRNKIEKSDERLDEKLKNVVESKFNKTALKPISIPEDPIDIVRENQKARETIIKQNIQNHNDSSDSSMRIKNGKNMKRSNNHQKEMNYSIEEEQVIVSSRKLENKVSPSMSPNKYDIVPRNIQKTFEIGPKTVKKTNYYSATNKKSKKYDHKSFEVNNSMRHKTKAESGGTHFVIILV
jgi:hypothetical protein